MVSDLGLCGMEGTCCAPREAFEREVAQNRPTAPAERRPPCPAGAPASPASAVPAPFDPAAYSPSGPLPTTIRPVRIESCGQKRWECEDPPDLATCELRSNQLFASWKGEYAGYELNVEVLALRPRSRSSDGSWARSLWEERVGLSQWREARVRSWRAGGRRYAESDVLWGAGGDRGWSVKRFEDRDGWILFLELVVAEWPSMDERTELRRIFVTGPLGSPPNDSRPRPR